MRLRNVATTLHFFYITIEEKRAGSEVLMPLVNRTSTVWSLVSFGCPFSPLGKWRMPIRREISSPPIIPYLIPLSFNSS